MNGTQAGTVDCGPLAALFLLAGAAAGFSHATISTWRENDVRLAGRYLRARMAVDLFGISAHQVHFSDAAVRGAHVQRKLTHVHFLMCGRGRAPPD